MSSHIQVVIISGSIGAGKSTFLKYIDALSETHKYVTVMPENIDCWNYWLKKYYDGDKDAAVLLQMQIINHYLDITKRIQMLDDEYRALNVRGIVFVERSPYDVRNVFLDLNKNLYSKTYLSAYETMCDMIIHAYAYWQSAVRYCILQKIDNNIEHVLNRSRLSEESMKINYVKQVYDRYNVLIKNNNNIIVIYNDGSINDLHKHAKEIFDYLLKIIK